MRTFPFAPHRTHLIEVQLEVWLQGGKFVRRLIKLPMLFPQTLDGVVPRSCCSTRMHACLVVVACAV
jgi:hypothetical protein